MRPDRDDPDVTHHDVSKLLRSTGAPSTGWWAVYRNPKTQQLWWNEVAGWAEVQRGSYSYNRKTHENSPVEWIDSRERDVPGVFVAGLVREYGLPSLVPVEEMYAQYEFTTYVFDPERKPDVASWIGSDEADERAAVEAA